MVNTPWGPTVVHMYSGGVRPRCQLTHSGKRICKEVTQLVNKKRQGSQIALLLPGT